MRLKRVLRQIQSDDANLSHGRLLRCDFDTATLAHGCRRGRPPHRLRPCSVASLFVEAHFLVRHLKIPCSSTVDRIDRGPVCPMDWAL